MKKTIGLFALAFIVLTACGPSSRVSDPEDVGDQVMNILEDLDDMSKEDFKENFLSFEEMQELAEDKEVITDADMRKRIKKRKESDYNEDMDKRFSRIIENGSELGIKWSEIEFVDFEYEVEKRGGMKGCGGKVIFKSGGKKFQVNSTSIFDGSGYCLMTLSGPRKYRD
ncbi:MAG: hypothetical protein ACFHU9_06095 [Fluviicola sp.]